MNFRSFLLCVPFIIFWTLSSGQSNEIDRLYDRLETPLQPTERARTMARLGMIYTERSLDSSYYYGNKALELAHDIHDKESEARALSVLAFYYMEKGKSYLSYKYANQALSIFESLNLKEQVAEMSMNIGVLLLKEGKIGQGVKQVEEAYRQSLELDNDSIRSLIILNMVMPQVAALSPVEVGQYLDEAERIATKHRDERMQVILKHARTSLKLRSGLPPATIRPQLKELRSEAQDRGFRYIEALTLLDLAHTFPPQEADSARYYIQSALEFAETLGYDQLKYVVLNHADRIWRSLNPPIDQANLYGAQIMEIDRARALQEEKDGLGLLELTIRENDLTMQKAKLEIEKLWSGIIGGIGVLAIFIALWAFRQYRLKRLLLRNLEITSVELERKNLQLEANDQFNTRLIAILSHDLRQPFASIQMMSKELLSDLSLSDQERVYQDIEQSSRLSLQVLDGLLYWMKLQTIGLAETPVSVPISESLVTAMEFYAHEIERSSIKISWDIHEEILVDAQPEMLLFVHRNLISNAIKYSPEGGTLTFKAFKNEQDRRVTVRISDSGAGIPEHVLKTIFIKSPSLVIDQGNHVKGGAGLALIICHEMLTEMNGRIWAENNAVGPGATFSYELPLGREETIFSQKAVESR